MYEAEVATCLCCQVAVASFFVFGNGYIKKKTTTVAFLSLKLDFALYDDI
jgi:hypothetical protein